MAYWTVKEKKKLLKKESKSLPKFFQQIISLYNLKIPVYWIPSSLMFSFAEKNVVGTVWREFEGGGKPLGILIANDEVLERYKNPSLSLLRTILHEIGHIMLSEEKKKFIQEIVKDRSLNRESRCYIVKLGLENRVEKWVKNELEKLKPFINTKRDGWRRGISFKEVMSILNKSI